MKAFLGKCIAGVFAFDENEKLIDKAVFEKNAEKIAEKLSGRCKEEKLLEEKLKKKGFEIIPREIRDFRRLALELKWVKSQAELNKILSQVNILLTKNKISKTGKDKILMIVVGILDELDRDLNIFTERLREWYGLYYPELEKKTESHERFVKLIAEHGSRDKMPGKETAKTAGMEFSREDLAQVMNFSAALLNFFEIKKEITKYLEKLAKEEIPNITAVTGPVLGARILALAGGLEKLSKMPSSKIQLLGAEKALFRHLRGGGKAPKYGILFSHPYVQNARNEMKGKVARIISAKLTLAARIDFFSKEDKSSRLKRELEEQVSKIKG